MQVTLALYPAILFHQNEPIVRPNKKPRGKQIPGAESIAR